LSHKNYPNVQVGYAAWLPKPQRFLTHKCLSEDNNSKAAAKLKANLKDLMNLCF